MSSCERKNVINHFNSSIRENLHKNLWCHFALWKRWVCPSQWIRSISVVYGDDDDDEAILMMHALNGSIDTINSIKIKLVYLYDYLLDLFIHSYVYHSFIYLFFALSFPVLNSYCWNISNVWYHDMNDRCVWLW